MISFHNAPPLVKTESALLVSWLASSVQNYGYSVRNVDYTFLSKSEMQRSNRQHLNHNYLTDIITFNYTKGLRLTVDMLISMDFIADYARSAQLPLADELDRVLIHGLLHCMGFDDKDEDKTAIMRREEDNCLLLRPKKLKFRSID